MTLPLCKKTLTFLLILCRSKLRCFLLTGISKALYFTTLFLQFGKYHLPYHRGSLICYCDNHGTVTLFEYNDFTAQTVYDENRTCHKQNSTYLVGNDVYPNNWMTAESPLRQGERTPLFAHIFRASTDVIPHIWYNVWMYNLEQFTRNPMEGFVCGVQWTFYMYV